MPVMNGIEALKEIVRQSATSVIMLSARTEQSAAITLEALAIGAVDFIPKTKGLDRLHEKLLAAVDAKTQRSRQSRPQASTRAPVRPHAPESARVNAKICIIGSSTGGPQALHAVLGQLPETLPVPIVVAQHMPPNFTKALAQRLDETCKPRIVEAEDGMTLAKGTVYIAPGGLQTRVTASEIRIGADQGESLYKPSIDVLVESARSAFGRRILGVMLTGMGSDGAVEFTKVHKLGGYTISQDQASCVVYGMPRSLVESGGASEVVPLDQIGLRIRTALGLAPH